MNYLARLELATLRARDKARQGVGTYDAATALDLLATELRLMAIEDENKPCTFEAVSVIPGVGTVRCQTHGLDCPRLREQTNGQR